MVSLLSVAIVLSLLQSFTKQEATILTMLRLCRIFSNYEQTGFEHLVLLKFLFQVSVNIY